jgi:hypothetical protein
MLDQTEMLAILELEQILVLLVILAIQALQETMAVTVPLETTLKFFLLILQVALKVMLV